MEVITYFSAVSYCVIGSYRLNSGYAITATSRKVYDKK